MSSALVPPPPPATQLLVSVGYGGEEGTSAVRGSYGPVIAMLAVLAVLAAVAVAVGRLCFGRRVLGQAGGGHDLEAWVERTCGPCVGASLFSAAPVAGSGGPAKEEGSGMAVAEPPPPEEALRVDGSGIVNAGSSNDFL